jgi:hypothetical protein
MDKEHYVDLSVIADFKLVKALTSDEGQILQAVKNSNKVCQADGRFLALAGFSSFIRAQPYTQVVCDE